ncbi:hypothetical protein K435DRAFT_969123 [Dendrothele bispora CBS 962.96]|uniref:Uncharacterized protein n=1 Tax=Dendrothele bispora (strain CBS 962.96) TaxID=1314807 RepID=A0A4S8LL54_DENBC|nr:hypothetical protein K435DRAFT_969123 [Dendrothele bispora CBS 962.96]
MVNQDPKPRSRANGASQPPLAPVNRQSGARIDPTPEQPENDDSETEELARRRSKFEHFAAVAHKEITSLPRRYDKVKKYQAIGKYWPRGIGLFVQVQSSLLDGLEWEKREARKAAGEDMDVDEEEEDESDDEVLLTRSRNLAAYQAVVERYPFFRYRLLECLEFDSKQTIDDLGNLTHSLAASMNKQDRGVNHPLTRLFLIPHTHMHLVFSQSEGKAKAKSILNDFKTNKIPIKTCCLPAFLYCMKLYDPEKSKSGLLRGPLLVFRAMFMGTSSALGDKVSSKPSNAKLHGITQVTPELIAYVAAQVRFALCTQASWRAKDKSFNLINFYHYILEIIKVKSKDNWRKNLLRFWNLEIFGSDLDSSLLKPPEDGTDMAKLYDEFENDSDEELEGDDVDNGIDPQANLDAA